MRLRARICLLIATALLSSLTTVAQAKELSPGKKKEVAGIVVADVGVGALVGGIIMVSVAAAADVAKRDPPLQSQLYAGGGALIGIGVPMIVVGTVVWMLGLREQKRAKAAAHPTTLRLVPAVERGTFVAEGS